MRSSFRKESFPICFLAPSEVKVGASAYKGTALRLVALLGTNAEHEDDAMAAAVAAKKATLRLENMIVVLYIFVFRFELIKDKWIAGFCGKPATLILFQSIV